MNEQYYKIGKTAQQLKVSASTLKNYTDQGRIKCEYNPGGQRLYSQTEIDRFLGKETIKELKTAHYSRSSSGDTTIINSQLEKLKTLYGEPDYTVKDRASGLNENRPGLKRLMKLSKEGQLTDIYFTSKDRLTYTF